MTSGELVTLLEQRHAHDLFVPQCKNGATSARRASDGPLRTLDAWAMPRTWSPITFIGYEIKVSRSDWLRDQKFADYFPLCHLLSVVAPRGVVELEELPKGVGLLEPIGAGAGQRLITRRKPARRAIETPVDLLCYVLMTRVKVRRNSRDWSGLNDDLDNKAGRALRMKAWAEEAELFNEVDRLVKARIVKRLRAAEDRMREAERKAEGLQHAADVLRELGIEHAGSDKYWLRQSINRAIARNADELLGTITTLGHKLDALERELRAAQEATITPVTEATA